MKYVYNNISEKDIELLLQDLNVTNQDDILVHGSELDKSNYDIITNSKFCKSRTI